MKVNLITQKKNIKIILSLIENHNFGIIDEPKISYGYLNEKGLPNKE